MHFTPMCRTPSWLRLTRPSANIRFGRLTGTSSDDKTRLPDSAPVVTGRPLWFAKLHPRKHFATMQKGKPHMAEAVTKLAVKPEDNKPEGKAARSIAPRPFASLR